MMNKQKIFVKMIISIFITFNCISLQAKPFKRVLVISGGGINPGLAIGVIAGVQSSGWKPDLIIATCGAGIGSIVNNSEKEIDLTYNLMKSKEFHQAISQVKIDTSNGITMMNKLNKAKDTSIFPDIFETLLLHSPDYFPKLIKTTEFNTDPAHPKLILVSTKSKFGPKDVGLKRTNNPLFQEVFFTDAQTAEHLKGWTIADKFAYPKTTVQKETEVYSQYDLITSMRAGIADPYLLNPTQLDGDYYFTGAVDLYPIDLAKALGDEVLATYPANLFKEFEDDAFVSAFGFKQTTRALETIQEKNIKWIDISDMDKLSFNPKRELITMVSGIPENYTEYESGIAQQWNFGFERAREAIKVAPGNVTDIRTHLRKPINPKLRDDFSCKNANEWETGKSRSCVSDKTPECNRKTNSLCIPIR